MKVSQARWLALAGLLALSVGADCASFDTEGNVCTTTHEGEKVCDEHSGSELVIICSADQEWEAYENCLDSDQVCVEIEGVVGEAECVDPTCSEGETRCSDDLRELETCDANGDWVPEACAEGTTCEVVDGDAMCVPGSGGTGGSGGMGGSAGTGGSAGMGGTGGGTFSCLEVNIPGLPQIAGTLSISPPVGVPDQFMTVTGDVDADTEELTATILNESSGFPGGSCFVLTGGNETVECDLRVETVAQPGPHVLELELRADPVNRLDYVLYAPGDGNTYVRVVVEDGVQGPETDTTCLVVNADIQF